MRKFLLKHVAGPLLGTVAAKVGEAIGDLIAYRINPPDPEPTPQECSEPLETED